MFYIDFLYNAYLESCADFEDFLLFKHVEGYHLISRKVEKIKNHIYVILKSMKIKIEFNNFPFHFKQHFLKTIRANIIEHVLCTKLYDTHTLQ